MKNSIKKKLLVICAASAVILSSASSVFAATSAPATVRPMPDSSTTSSTTTGSSTGTSTGVTAGTSSSGSTGTSSVTSSGTSASSETSTSGAGNYKASRSTSDDDEDSDTTTSSDDSDGTGVTRAVPTAVAAAPEATMNVVANTQQTAVDTKKYVSKGGMVGWLFLSIIINALISFWIGNRFYRLSKKDSHVTTEIRALRRDVEEKFIGSVGGFTEQETDIANANDDYSLNPDGITMPQRQPVERRTTAEEDDAFKKWESQMNTRTNSSRTSRQSHVEGFDEFEQSLRRKKYQPQREEIEEEIDDEYEEDEKKSSLNSVKSKAKEFLGDIFPFKED